MAKNSIIFLNLVKTLTPKKINSILRVLNDNDDILSFSEKKLLEIPLLTKKDIDEIIRIKTNDILDKELKLIASENISVIDIFDKDYPKLLKEISNPPIVLYIKGNVASLNDFIFSIVGTRIPSIYGLNMSENFASRLASLGVTIISGLARGIDTAAHKGALKTGKTIAVLGSGILNVYPKENKRLSDLISENGALISEFPLLEPPLKENFPRRNRIVSGLAAGVLVIEAAERSGALITAHCALEQNREVFALPGKIDSPLSKGTHILIKEGAKLVDSIADILEELNIKFESAKEEKNTIKLNDEEKTVLEMIKASGVYLEEIILKSNLEQPVINKVILNLQLNGVIKEIRPSCFVRC
ncbi:MAG: DNA-processing protein DprA [Candidatus Omnitrophota bacterium]|jgi:DNA processing protein